MADIVFGANAAGYHLAGVNWGRDLPEPDVVADIRNPFFTQLSRAVEDGATVPVYFEPRLIKVGLAEGVTEDDIDGAAVANAQTLGRLVRERT